MVNDQIGNPTMCSTINEFIRIIVLNFIQKKICILGYFIYQMNRKYQNMIFQNLFFKTLIKKIKGINIKIILSQLNLKILKILLRDH